MEKKLTSLEKHWILYDVGNSAFILLVATLLPIYFNALAGAAGIDESDYLAYWGYAGSVATILVAVIAPICGALADQRGFKKPLFLVCLALGAVGCAALGGAWSWFSFLAIYVAAKVGYSAANVFYDSMLTEITTPERMDRVSSLGYAFGYIGSVIPFVLCLGLVLGHGALGIDQTTALVISFVLTALWWVGCTVPLIRSYRQHAYAQSPGNPVAAAFRQIGATLRDARQHKHIFLYLLAFFFFIDGVYTIIDMATAYGKALGLDTTGLLLALLLTQIVAFPCAILFGKLTQRFASAKLISVCIGAYFVVAVYALWLDAAWKFWMMATFVGVFQGAIQALSRSYYAKIIPKEKSTEYFGIFDIFGKGASFMGTMLMGITTQLFDTSRAGVAAIAAMFVVGFICFQMQRRCMEGETSQSGAMGGAAGFAKE